MNRTLRRSRRKKLRSVSSYRHSSLKVVLKFGGVANIWPDPINQPVRRQTPPIQVSSESYKLVNHMRHITYYSGMIRDLHVILHESELQPRQPLRARLSDQFTYGPERGDNSPQ